MRCSARRRVTHIMKKGSCPFSSFLFSCVWFCYAIFFPHHPISRFWNGIRFSHPGSGARRPRRGKGGGGSPEGTCGRRMIRYNEKPVGPGEPVRGTCGRRTFRYIRRAQHPPASSGPSGAGSSVMYLAKIQNPRPYGATPHPSAFGCHLPLKGKAFGGCLSILWP